MSSSVNKIFVSGSPACRILPATPMSPPVSILPKEPVDVYEPLTFPLGSATEPLIEAASREPLIIDWTVEPKVTVSIFPLSMSTLVIFWLSKSIAPVEVNAPMLVAVRVSLTTTFPSLTFSAVPEPLISSEPVNWWESPTLSPKIFEPVAWIIDELINVVWISSASSLPVTTKSFCIVTLPAKLLVPSISKLPVP